MSASEKKYLIAITATAVVIFALVLWLMSDVSPLLRSRDLPLLDNWTPATPATGSATLDGDAGESAIVTLPDVTLPSEQV